MTKNVEGHSLLIILYMLHHKPYSPLNMETHYNKPLIIIKEQDITTFFYAKLELNTPTKKGNNQGSLNN